MILLVGLALLLGLSLVIDIELDISESRTRIMNKLHLAA